MKKGLISVLIVLILTNFICCNNCYADFGSLSVDSSSINMTPEKLEKFSEDGTATVTDSESGKNTEMSVTDAGPSMTGTVVGVMAKWINFIPLVFHYIVSVSLNYGGIIDKNSESFYALFTIQNIVNGKYYFLDSNVFKDAEEVYVYESNATGITRKIIGEDDSMCTVLEKLRSNVALWFIIIRDLAMAINLGMLLYIGIRMAISTISSDKAKYKELLYNWVMSMIILFCLQYIFVIINEVSDAIVRLGAEISANLEASGSKSFETEIITTLLKFQQTEGGLRLALYMIIYWILVFSEIKFFLIYAKRMLTIFFLIIISPIITVTYAADKVGDGKAQAFGGWIKDYASNVFMQPIHCFSYLVFIFMANNIAVRAPLVGVIFLLSLTSIEKTVKKILGVAATNSLSEGGKKLSLRRVAGRMKGLMPRGGRR